MYELIGTLIAFAALAYAIFVQQRTIHRQQNVIIKLVGFITNVEFGEAAPTDMSPIDLDAVPTEDTKEID